MDTQQDDQKKRKRLTTACNTCRRKKIKCDGLQPTCGKCAKFNLECSYTTVTKKRGPRQGHMDAIEKRLRKMEEMISGKSSTRASSPPLQPPTQALPAALPTHPILPAALPTHPILPDTAPTAPAINSTVALPTPINSTSSIPTASNSTSTNHPISFNSEQEDGWPPADIIDHLLPLFLNHSDYFPSIVEIEKLVELILNKTCNLFLLLAILSLSARFSDRPDLITSPRWLSGEKFSTQARKMLTDISETPSIEHLQGLLVLILYEYGCARGPRVWYYTGMAVRMALELGLHKERILEQEMTTISFDTWLTYETRRRVFWEIFTEDKVASATTGRPQMMDLADITTLLPVWSRYLELETKDIFYQQSLDRTQLVRYAAIRDPKFRKITSFHVSMVNLSIPANMFYLNEVGLESRLLEQVAMMSKICNLINRGYTNYISSTATAKIDEGMLEVERLNIELDDWYSRLPPSLKDRTDTLHQKNPKFILLTFLHHGLMVLLNRPALALADVPKLRSTTAFTQEAVHRNINRCIEAANTITTMLKELSSKTNLIPSLPAYFVYIAATVIISNIFSDDPILSKKSDAALNEYYQYYEILKPNWATVDKLYFLTRDLYAVHKKAHSTYPSNQPKPVNQELTPKVFPKRHLSLADLPLLANEYPTPSNWSNQDSVLPVSSELPTFSFLPKMNNLNMSSFDTWLQEQQLLQRKQ